MFFMNMILISSCRHQVNHMTCIPTCMCIDSILLLIQHNARGMLSMANSGPNTNGSQFFITYAKQPHLNGLYTIFGKVIHGFEVLDIMEKVSPRIFPFQSMVENMQWDGVFKFLVLFCDLTSPESRLTDQ